MSRYGKSHSVERLAGFGVPDSLSVISLTSQKFRLYNFRAHAHQPEAPTFLPIPTSRQLRRLQTPVSHSQCLLARFA